MMPDRTRKPTRKPTQSFSSLPNFVQLVDRYQQAVVGIEVVHRQPATRMFGGFGTPWDRGNSTAPRTVNIGTGFVFHPRGYILTNQHVVHQASEISIRVPGKKENVPARVLEQDFRHDIAILQADIPIPQHLLSVSQSKDVRVGEWVVAIGSPLGLDNTVTVGIVSAKNRPLEIGEREYPSLLQTDAAINRGNSGGPLINLRGEVIGMNTAVSQSSQGIGFAISADVLRQVVQRLLKVKKS